MGQNRSGYVYSDMGPYLLAREHVQHLAVRAFLVAAAAEVEREQVRWRPGEANSRGKEHRTAKLLTRGGELDVLVLCVGGEYYLL